jgi:hypothetical protein
LVAACFRRRSGFAGAFSLNEIHLRGLNSLVKERELITK